MNLEYFKEKICEELDGAKEYAKNALEIKPMNASWGKLFIDMANAEIQHATHLYKMAEELYQITSKSYTDIPEYMEEIRNCIIDKFAEKSSKVKYIIEMYNK